MVDGVVFTILFAVRSTAACASLPDTPGGDIWRGLTYGEILGLISMGFLVPYVYAPKSGLGLFSFGTPDEWKLPLSIARLAPDLRLPRGRAVQPGSCPGPRDSVVEAD